MVALTQASTDAAKSAARSFACRFCSAPLATTLVDVGMSSLCQTQTNLDQLQTPEPLYPPHVYVGDRCLLVLLQEFVTPDEMFFAYACFSSYSTSWVEHAPIIGRQGRLAAQTARIALSRVLEREGWGSDREPLGGSGCWNVVARPCDIPQIATHAHFGKSARQLSAKLLARVESSAGQPRSASRIFCICCDCRYPRGCGMRTR
jgi:hypothetical protein